jgi:hypothetical protein
MVYNFRPSLDQHGDSNSSCSFCFPGLVLAERGDRLTMSMLSTRDYLVKQRSSSGGYPISLDLDAMSANLDVK